MSDRPNCKTRQASPAEAGGYRPMRCLMRGAAGLVLIAVGCHAICKTVEAPEPTVSQYHAADFAWSGVSRVMMLPLLNESPYTRAGDEVGRALATELQQLGRFEVVAPPDGCDARLAAQIHRDGRFDEAILYELARTGRADVILHGTITQYCPYPRPRLGLVLQAVNPRTGKVAASADGLWDSAQRPVEVRAKLYYHQLPMRPPWTANHAIAPDDGFADELALDSPLLFQRFVCHEAVRVLVSD